MPCATNGKKERKKKKKPDNLKEKSCAAKTGAAVQCQGFEKQMSRRGRRGRSEINGYFKGNAITPNKDKALETARQGRGAPGFCKKSAHVPLRSEMWCVGNGI